MRAPSYIQKSNFDGGLNDSQNPLDVRPNQLTDVQNMVPLGGSIQKRRGMTTYPATQSQANRTLGLFELRTRAGLSYKVGLFADGAGYLYSNGAWAAISGATGLNTTARWSAVNAYIAGGTNRDALILTNYYDVPKKFTESATKDLHTCEITTNWTAGGSASTPAVNSVTFQQGTAAISLGCSTSGQLDGCESKTGWTLESSNSTVHTLTLMSSPVYEGSKSIQIYWGDGVGAGSENATYYKTIASTDLTGDSAYVRVYLNNYLLFTGTGAIKIRWGNNSSNYYEKSYNKADLANGWNLLGGLVSGMTVVGSPDITQITYIAIRGVSSSSTPNSMIIDDWHVVASTTFTYTITTLGTVVGTGYSIGLLDLYITDTDTLHATTAVKLYLGTDSSNYYHKTYTRAQLADGWNQLGGAFSGWTEQGTVNIASLDYLKIEMVSAGGAIPSGDIVMDWWRLSGGAAPTWGTLGGTPPRAKYSVAANNYILLGCCKDNSDNTLLYPGRVYYSGHLDPETWNSAAWIDCGSSDGLEITGMAEQNGTVVVFKEKGIYELHFTGSTSLPYTRHKIYDDIGAFHNTVQAGDGFIIFANYAGVFGYQVGGIITPLSKNLIDNTFKSHVIQSNKDFSLSGLYVPDAKQYWLACGENAANDTALILDMDTRSWWVFNSAISGFDISCFGLIYDEGAYVPWIGLSTGHCVTYSEHYTDYPRRTDTAQNGTALDVTASFKTHNFHWGNPPILKRLFDGNIEGWQNSSSDITLSIEPDEKTAVTLGTFNLVGAYGVTKKRWKATPGASYGYRFVMSFSETGGSASDTRWRIDNIGLQAMMMGVE